MEVIVVGAGIMGLAVAWACHRRGHTVRVYEQGPIPNPFGSSVDDHRAIRTFYAGREGYARMVEPAFAAWERLWEDLGERLYVENGVLTLDSGPGSYGYESVANLDRLDIPYESLEPTEIERRFPLLRFDGAHRGLYSPRGGTLLAGRIVELLAHFLGTNGVGVESHAEVTAVDPDGGRITLADGRTVGADRVVIAAGPWVTALLPEFAARVTPSRQVVAYLVPPEDLAGAWSRAPVLIDIQPDTGLYLIPPVAGTAMKVGEHGFSLRGAPDRDREAAADETRAIFELCRDRVRDFDRFRLAGGRTCFYTVEPSESFIVEPIGTRGWVMCGFSGHGFKFGPLLGLELAAALAGDRDPAALSRWAAGRQKGNET